MKNRIELIILFLAIIASGGHIFINRIFLFALIYFLFFIYVFISGTNKVHLLVRLFKISMLVLICGIIHTLMIYKNQNDMTAFGIRYLNFIAALMVILIYDFKSDTFRQNLYRITKLFVYLSFITIVLYIIAPGYFIPYVTPTGESYLTFWGVFWTTTASPELGYIFPRNTGFFWEPGVLQIYLNIFLFITLHYAGYRTNKMVTFFAIIAIISTQSTTGLIIMLIILSTYVLNRLLFIKTSFTKRIITIIPIAIFVIIFIFSLPSIMDKFNGQSRGSFWARQYDSYTGLEVAIAHPIIGIGFSDENYKVFQRNFGYKESQMTLDFTFDRGCTNSLVTLFYSVGFILSLCIIFWFLKQTFINIQKNTFTIIIFLAIMAEPLLFTPFFLVFIISGALWVGRHYGVQLKTITSK